MNPAFYDEYAAIEDSHWWFRGRRSILRHVLARIAARRLARIVDVGFGTGAMLDLLSEFGDVIGMDQSIDAVRWARRRGARRPLVLGSVLALPFQSRSVDLVTAFDIIEHVDDDAAAVAELTRVCRPGGHVLVTVPAFQFLWGNQDVVSHHKRRYTRGWLASRMRDAGLRIRMLSYFNSVLFPAIASVRLARRAVGRATAETAQSDFVMTRPGLMNETLTRVFAAERWLIGRVPFPAGVSLVCVAERPPTP